MTQYEDLQFLNILPKSIVLKVVLSSLRLISPPTLKSVNTALQ